MKIIITMAGLGRRFTEQGYKLPKYKISVNNRTLFEWALTSLTDFFIEEFIFVTRKEIFDEEFMITTCKNLGIIKYKFIVLEEETDGQATTALLADKYINDDDSIAIYNIDTYVKPYTLKKENIDNSYSGYIPVIKASSDKWSFVKVDEHSFATEVAEKKQISNLATIGFYYFNKWKTYKETYKIMLEQIKKENKEVYIAPMYQNIIENNGNVFVELLQTSTVEIIGTPEELKTFKKKTL